MRSASLYIAPRQIDRGDIQWQYERAQKEGSAEAAPGGRKSKVIVILVIILYHNFFTNIKCTLKRNAPSEKIARAEA